jgi:predicted RNA binding protein YcfA (HicA-like mRNA interferase family)
MPKRYSSAQIIKALSSLGFIKISQKGSHLKMRGIIDGQLRTTIIPTHKQIATGTLASILRQANISKIELDDHIK